MGTAVVAVAVYVVIARTVAIRIHTVVPGLRGARARRRIAVVAVSIRLREPVAIRVIESEFVEPDRVESQSSVLELFVTVTESIG